MSDADEQAKQLQTIAVVNKKSISSFLSVNKHLEINNFFILAAVGIIIKLFLKGNNPSNSTIWGYGLTSVSLFFIIMISVGLSYKKQKVNFFKKFFEDSFPILLLILLLMWIVTLNLNYSSVINQKKVPSEYNYYSFLSTVMILLQLILLYIFLRDKLNFTIFDNFVKDSEHSKTSETEQALVNQSKIESGKNEITADKIKGINYIFTFVNSIIIGMMQIILTFFLTDG